MLASIESLTLHCKLLAKGGYIYIKLIKGSTALASTTEASCGNIWPYRWFTVLNKLTCRVFNFLAALPSLSSPRESLALREVGVDRPWRRQHGPRRRHGTVSYISSAGSDVQPYMRKANRQLGTTCERCRLEEHAYVQSHIWPHMPDRPCMLFTLFMLTASARAHATCHDIALVLHPDPIYISCLEEIALSRLEYY